MAGPSGLALRLQELPQFIRFAIVGGLGFFTDVAVLMLLMQGFGLGPYQGRVLSYLSGATATWWLNRNFTFVRRGSAHRVREWLLFVSCSALAGLLNYAAYALFVFLFGERPSSAIIGVALGACAGLWVNYTLSSRVVFRQSGG
jgi:putative flippase GtrA